VRNLPIERLHAGCAIKKAFQQSGLGLPDLQKTIIRSFCLPWRDEKEVLLLPEEVKG
jgi:hypothetical protein